jgi:hypothetical protein
VVAAPGQLALTAAQLGTVIGLGTGDGETTGLGLADGLGLGLGLELGDTVGLERDGLWRLELDPFGPHAEKVSTRHASKTPVLTGESNEPCRTAAAQFQLWCKAPRISASSLAYQRLRIKLIRVGGLVAVAALLAACSSPVPLTANVTAVASTSVTVGGTAQLVVTVVNTGPRIPHLGLVFRTQDKWFDVHKMTDLGGCSVSTDRSAFDCGDLQVGATGTYSFSGTAIAAGSFHYELALRELVQPFDYVNEHSDGPDVQVWDERATSA